MKKHRTVTLSQDVIQGIKEEAAEDGRSFSGMINWILRKHLEAVELQSAINEGEEEE